MFLKNVPFNHTQKPFRWRIYRPLQQNSGKCNTGPAVIHALCMGVELEEETIKTPQNTRRKGGKMKIKKVYHCGHCGSTYDEKKNCDECCDNNTEIAYRCTNTKCGTLYSTRKGAQNCKHEYA